MILNCKECGKPIPAIDINIASLMAKCGNCNAVFSFEDRSNSKKQSQGFDVRRSKVPLPNGIKDKESNNQLEIRMSWFRWTNVFLTFFTLFWDAFMIAWFTISITSDAWPMALFGSLHGGVGLYLTYTVIAGYVNKTILTVSRQTLSVKIGPLPWKGNQTLSSSDIVQLYSKRVIIRGKHTTTSYEVHAILMNGTHLCLVKSLNESEQAFYFEQKIEDYLQIEDEPVKGEMER